jgi:hypothetical protein
VFRSQIDHHQGGTIFFLTSVTKFYFILLIDVAAFLQVTIKINLVGNKLIHMYYLIWSSGCLLSLAVVMCVLGKGKENRQPELHIR